MVEACLWNSLFQYSKGTPYGACAIPGFEPMPLLGPTIEIKLYSTWCTVELKVVGNLECRIKFYRKKKPRHFFYTIEYPYPPTNSVGVMSAQRKPTTLLRDSIHYHNLSCRPFLMSLRYIHILAWQLFTIYYLPLYLRFTVGSFLITRIQIE